MKSHQQKRTRSSWSSRLLNIALLLTLILGPLALPGAAAAQAPAWEFKGPAPQTNAQQDLVNVAAANEPVSGAVSAIAASPTDPNLVYIGAANGGIWKTTNATVASPTWTPLTDQLQSLSIGIDALALDPLDATGQTVIAGTGRFSGYANRGDDHVGIYYTTDGGANWTVSASPLLSAARITGVAARGNTLLVASENGLFRSTTGPLGTWTKISGSGGLPDARAADITADPNDTNRFYVTFVGASGGLFRTDDLGATWTNVTGAISGITASTDAFEVAVFNNGAASAVSVVLNGVGGDAEANAIFYSANGGAFTALDVPDVFKDAYGKFGLTADKTNPNLVYVSGGYALIGSDPFLALTYRIDASQASGSQLTHLYRAVSTTTLLSTVSDSQTYINVKSTASLPASTPFVVTLDSEDMTVTAVNPVSWYYQLTVVRGANSTTPAPHGSYTMVTPPATHGAPHVDINNLTIDANGGLLMGAHGGIFSLPQPASPTSDTNTWFSRNGNLGVTEMHDVAYDHVSDILIGSNQDNCVVFQSATGSTTWPVAPGSSGDGGDVAVADIGGGQSIRYISTQNLGSFQRLVYDAANNQVSKTTLSTSAVTDKQFTTPIAVNAVDPNRLLIGGSANLYESLDMGATINKIATVGVYHRAIAYGGRKDGVANPDVLYAANTGNTFYARTAADGAVAAAGTLPSGASYIRDIVMNPDDWMNVFVSDFDQVFASTDAGATWSDITGDLLSVSSAEISTIEFVEGPSPYIAVGTRSGVFASRLSALGSWIELGTDLPDVLTFELDYDAVDDVLAAGTLGRGAWLLADASDAFVLPAVAPVLALSGPTTADEGATKTYNFTVDDPGDSFTVSTLTVGAGGTLVAGSLSTTGAGGSFQVSFDDGPATVGIDLQVTDSTALTSNLESTSVTVNNVTPTPIILGLPTSGSVGTPVNVTASATDPSAVDTAAGFTHAWQVDKLISGTWYFFTNASGPSLSFTPDASTTYRVWLKATDKDSGYRWTYKTMTAASPDLTIADVSLTVPEGQTAENSGTYAHKGPAPITISANVGSVTQTITSTTALTTLGYWQLGEDDPGAVPGDYTDAVVDDTPEAYWRLDETTGSAATDSVNSYDGTYNGNPILGQPGPVPPEFPGLESSNRAPTFDGSGDYVQISSVVPFGTAYAVELWFRANYSQLSGNNTLFSAFNATNHGILVEINNQQLRFLHRAVLGNTGGQEIFYSFPTASGDPFYSTFHHIVAVKEEGTNGLKLFLDGKLVGTATPTGPTSFPNLNVLFGRLLPADGTRDYAGSLDEVAIYTQALTAADVQHHYDAANPPTLGHDSSGLNPALNLTRHGSPAYVAVDGSYGSVLAMSFNGTTDGYTLGSPLTTATNNFGIEAWVRLNSVAGNQIIAYNGDTGFNGFGLMVYNGKFAGLYGGVIYLDSGVAATTGSWHHLALVRDNGATKIYIDGVVYNVGTSGPNAATTGFAIGQAPQGAVHFLNGSADDVRVFTFAPGAFDPQDLGLNTSVAGTWSWSYPVDDGPDSQTVTITASSGAPGDSSSLPFPLTVENVAPAATFANGGAVDEGSSGTVSFSDPFDPSTADAAALRYAYDFDNDGTFDSGDGTYAGSGSNASETVPASYLADGPATRTVRGRILDKDGDYSDYTTDITINNAAPTASVTGPATALVGQLIPFTVGATDPSSADQAAGFEYNIDWGDGSLPEAIAQVEGNGSAVARHAYAGTGNYTIQVTATDRDGGTSPTPGSTSVQVNTLDAASLQTLIAGQPYVEFAPADDAAFQNEVAAINGLSDPGTEVAITLILGMGPYTGVTLSPPANVILDLAGNDTADWTGTQINGSSPAVTVTSGEVFVQGNVLSTPTDDPTVLVTGGHLTLDQVEIQESTGFNNVGVRVTGGSVNLGFDVLINVNGEGGFVDSYVRSALVPHPEGIDAELTPNTFQVDGETINAVSLSSTGLTSSANPTLVGESVTFTATIDVKAIEHGPATGTVSFYEGDTLLGTDTVSYVDRQFVASLTTAALGQGSHTIKAVYNGDDAYVASAAELTQQVNSPTAVTLARFDGRVMADGSVLLEWETASEVDLLGFYVYRAASATDTPVRLNADLIPSQSPGSSTGGSYSYQDQTAVPGTTYYYWLEDVDVHGAATRHGPVSVTVEPEGGFTIYLPLVSKH